AHPQFCSGFLTSFPGRQLMLDVSNRGVVPASSPPSGSLQEGGWPAASLAEHVALGKFDRGISLLAWAYNEEILIEDFLQRAVELLDQAALDWEIVLVDDCSTDRTAEIVAAFAARERRIRLVRHERNLNVGMACRTAIAHAGKEFLFWQTVDWSYDIGKLRIFL